MNERDVTKTEAVGTQPPGRAAKPVPPDDGAGPTSPGLPEPASDTIPDNGGYDGSRPNSGSDNAKGGYGAG